MQSEPARLTFTALARVQRQNPAKLSATVLAALGRYYLKQLEDGGGHLVRELQEFHSSQINPKALAVPHSWFDAVAKEPP